MKRRDALMKLYKSLKERWRPEDVLVVLSEMGLWEGPARTSSTSMSREFRRAIEPEKQLKSAAELFPRNKVPEEMTPKALREYVMRLGRALGMGPNFTVRLTKKQRRRELIEAYQNHRAYNKRVRFVMRFREKVNQYERQLLLTDLAQVAKSRLANRITFKEFAKDTNAAAYAAYYAARLNRRTIFTWGTQERAYDQVSKHLTQRLNSKSNWLIIAMVDPTRENMAKLTKRQLGQLVGESFELMKSAADVLGDLAKDGSYRLDTMIVRRGNDSSTWNEAAGSYNKCRDIWISAMIASGMAPTFDRFLPTKALRLMAADVAFMHRHYGAKAGEEDTLDPDTRVWKELPKPWDVISGKQNCNRKMIEHACAKCGVDPHRGWLGWEEGDRLVETTKPTPELVHGVVVASPAIASILKRHGYFSGKRSLGFAPFPVVRDYSGGTLKVDAV